MMGAAEGTPARISVCIATYRRPDLLGALLGDLAVQTRLPEQIVIVDNDAAASAAAVVNDWRARLPRIDLSYEVQPEQNISLTRNRTVALADGDLLAFIDDDERAPPHWLAELEAALLRFNADGALAPVLPVLPAHAPEWIRRGGFYDRYQMPTGSVVPPNELRIGNAILVADRLRWLDPVFNPDYGLTGGEDGDMLLRLVNGGARLIWCEAAAVSEPVPEARLRLGWILKRAMRGGQDFARHFRVGRFGGRPSTARSVMFFARAASQMVTAAGLAILTLPVGRHRAAYWLGRACANFGKLSVLLGWHYREYAQPPAVTARIDGTAACR
ncbi:glycosyltransferase family 2 protein [Roseococcus pinisoli]|uniref:Glycosyltransferase n=1 Tax=Roseococcus pinisoli TaxID=2835040 RepID=A0ABS5QE34_9PROT|nr:glycosyltransferase family A protein [Roseococcus pinisoli]MBS7811738.1 glycosyltransferase [Roseococcus pinisoli]